jgi:translation elongation factor EF-Ts
MRPTKKASRVSPEGLVVSAVNHNRQAAAAFLVAPNLAFSSPDT